MPRNRQDTPEVKIQTDMPLAKINEEQFKAKNIVKQEQFKVKAGNKTKVIERTEYKSGVVKQRCVGIIKENKVLYDAGIKI